MIELTVYGEPAPQGLPVHIRRNYEVDPETGCWLWTRSKSLDGYGWTSLNDKTYQAHRLVWILLVGPIPDGLVIDHLCRTRHCVNVTHMELVTPGENVRRSPTTPAGQEHCLKCGGEFSIINKGKKHQQRRCIPCMKTYYAKRRQG